MDNLASIRENKGMSDGGDWSGVSAFDGLIMAITAVGGFLSGVWARGSSAGQLRSDVAALKEQLLALQRRDESAEAKLARTEERINSKVDSIETRVGLLATRDEVNAMGLRIENRLYDLVTNRIRPPPPPPLTLD